METKKFGDCYIMLRCILRVVEIVAFTHRLTTIAEYQEVVESFARLIIKNT